MSNEECLLWKLDRGTFNYIVKDAANKKRDHYEQFLSKVSLFSTMEPYERSKLSDAFKEIHFKKDELIIREGEAGNDLFLL
jgi:cAMP-dependent protein kinase regulator